MQDISEVDLREYYKAPHEGKTCRIVRIGKTYQMDINRIWEAITQENHIPNWFLPISGDLTEGGNYDLVGNASGKILVCKAPHEFKITWEFMGDVSWVAVSLEEENNSTNLILSHIMNYGEGDPFWAKYGPGATGVGWGLCFLGLTNYLATSTSVVEEGKIWIGTDEGRTFLKSDAESWADVHIATGEDPETARNMADETYKFYAGLGG